MYIGTIWEVVTTSKKRSYDELTQLELQCEEKAFKFRLVSLNNETLLLTHNT